ncbi:hypothetical protein [Vulcanisaeta distributa]|uniref:Uncharacterized protein n=1 Tax=Vulcanisaeta distributa (strain DSM 14429 / JCM 11212 / NBRC 100878 / IC-017) TaxID=572478 RepID=E1QRG2_VULDI|nr:hypothetical protein [Vulcanisaeta distributa]ADN50659.1 hypothetical protein Vdis_1273 [Vulcanisaeta distributa DSM 14429]
MRIGIRMRGLIIKVSVFLSLAIAAVVGIRFVSPVLAPIIILILLILVILLNKLINRKLASMWGPQLLSIDNYAIYEKGIYVKPMDAFYPWSELIMVRNDQSIITFVFNDGTEISLSESIIESLRGCPCINRIDNAVGK